jgi:hypothetical protein
VQESPIHYGNVASRMNSGFKEIKERNAWEMKRETEVLTGEI